MCLLVQGPPSLASDKGLSSKPKVKQDLMRLSRSQMLQPLQTCHKRIWPKASFGVRQRQRSPQSIESLARLQGSEQRLVTDTQRLLHQIVAMQIEQRGVEQRENESSQPQTNFKLRSLLVYTRGQTKSDCLQSTYCIQMLEGSVAGTVRTELRRTTDREYAQSLWYYTSY